MVQPLWKTALSFLKKLKIELLYDSANPRLRIICLNKAKALPWKDARTTLFTAALFTRAKTQKQPKCPQTGVDKENVILTGTLLSHKRNETLPLATIWMDLAGIIRKRNQSVRERYTV